LQDKAADKKPSPRGLAKAPGVVLDFFRLSWQSAALRTGEGPPIERIQGMGKKEGLLTSLKTKIWASVMSGIAAVTGSGTLYFWKQITGDTDERPRWSGTRSGSSRGDGPRKDVPQYRSAFVENQPPSTSPQHGVSQQHGSVHHGHGPFIKAQPTAFKTAKDFFERRGKLCPVLGCRLDEEADGLRILHVPPGTVAAQFGLMPGDVIEKINARPLQTTEDLAAAVARTGPFQSHEFHVRRGETRLEGDFRFRTDSAPTVRSPLRPARKQNS